MLYITSLVRRSARGTWFSADADEVPPRCGRLPDHASGRGRGRRCRGTSPVPAAGRPGRPRKRPKSLLGDKGYDSRHVRRELIRRRILPVISRRGEPDIRGLGRLRYVVEQTFALLHQFERLAVRWERRLELHDSLVSLACSLICWRRINKPAP
ncbi:transposase [Kitasatospora griseola]|uniref:transposase n=1 Tax=Kitasatospora griseola TaxID=2064 RepID=UPI0037F6664B